MFARRSTSLRWSPVLRCQTLRVDGRTCCGEASGRSPTPCCPYGGARRRARPFPLRSGRDTYSRALSEDRTSGGSGKRVSGRVDIGGSRNIKKTNSALFKRKKHFKN